MTHREKREERKSPSDPRLVPLDWEDLEPTELIERSIEKLKETRREVRESMDTTKKFRTG